MTAFFVIQNLMHGTSCRVMRYNLSIPLISCVMPSTALHKRKGTLMHVSNGSMLLMRYNLYSGVDLHKQRWWSDLYGMVHVV